MAEIRKLAAILAADIVGYSRLAGADEDRILARLRALRSASSTRPSPCITAASSSAPATACCRVSQRGRRRALRHRSSNAMSERNAGVPEDRRIDFRIGIHVGDVVEESDGDLMGHGVNIAARLEGVAEPGAICLSEQAYWQVKGRLDVTVTDLGPVGLRTSPSRCGPIRSKSASPPAPSPHRRRTRRRGRSVRRSRRWFWRSPHCSSRSQAAPGISWSRATPPPSSRAGRRPSRQIPQPQHRTRRRRRRTLDRRAAVQEPLGRSQPGLFRRRDNGKHHHGIVADPQHFVISRETAFTFKGNAVDPREIGKELGVRYVARRLGAA